MRNYRRLDQTKGLSAVPYKVSYTMTITPFESNQFLSSIKTEWINGILKHETISVWNKSIVLVNCLLTNILNLNELQGT